MKFIAIITGGTGDGVWDSEATVEAGNIREALDKLEPEATKAGGVIVAIEQEEES